MATRGQFNGMFRAETHPGDELTIRPPVPTPLEIRNHLRDILESPVFHGSKRSRQFLAYVCEEMLAGRSATLKERTIAVEVFGRNPNSDLADDTIVRVGAREVRKRLQQYYASAAGSTAGIHIDLPIGSYAPEFRYATPVPPSSVPAQPEAVVLRARPWLIPALVVTALVLIALFTLRWTRPTPEQQAFRDFWRPVFQSTEPLLLAVSHPIVYHPSARAVQLSESLQPPQDINVPRPLQVPPGELNGADIRAVLNQYVGYGDMVAANEVTAMLAERSRKVRLRLSSGIEFPELRKTNTLLIGAISNRWTMQLQPNWRFQFRWTPAVRTVVVDTTQPHREWFVNSQADDLYQEDYVVVSRIRNSLTGGLLLVGAGLKGFGTEAAGRLLADADQLGGILRKLPSGWENRNLQLVLRVKVMGNTPAQPELLASHVW